MHGQELRSNSSVESWNGRLNKIIKVAHPNFWEFVVKITGILEDTATEMERLNNGLRITRKRGSKYTLVRSRLAKAEAKLVAGEITPMTFIRQGLYSFITLADRLAEGVEQSHEDDQEEEIEEEEDEEVAEQQAEQDPEAPAAVIAAEAVTNAMACRVCTLVPYNTMITPCMHLACCSECASTIEASHPPRNVCPVCRGPIGGLQRVFLG